MPSGSVAITAWSNGWPAAIVMSAIGVTTGEWLTIVTTIGTTTLVESGPPSPSLVAVKVTSYVPAWSLPGVQEKRAVSGSKEAPGGSPLTA